MLVSTTDLGDQKVKHLMADKEPLLRRSIGPKRAGVAKSSQNG